MIQESQIIFPGGPRRKMTQESWWQAKDIHKIILYVVKEQYLRHARVKLQPYWQIKGDLISFWVECIKPTGEQKVILGRDLTIFTVKTVINLLFEFIDLV